MTKVQFCSENAMCKLPTFKTLAIGAIFRMVNRMREDNWYMKLAWAGSNNAVNLRTGEGYLVDHQRSVVPLAKGEYIKLSTED